MNVIAIFIDIYCDLGYKNSIVPSTRENDWCRADWQIHVSSALKVLFASKFYLFSIQMLLARPYVSLRSLFYEPRPVKFFNVPSIVGYAFSRDLNEYPYR